MVDAAQRVCDSHGLRKYQFMEANTQRRAAGLKDKIPDIKKTLETVRFLKSRTVRVEGVAQSG